MLKVGSVNLSSIKSVPAREVPPTDSVCVAILKRFSESDECPENWPDDFKQDGAPLVRRESTIYRLSSVSGRRSICIKVVTRGSRELQDAASLYVALRHYHARSDRERGFTVPEPYGWIPEHRAVIMEWVEGRTFSEILKKELFLTKRRHESIRKVAGWLRWFHSQSKVERGSLANGWQLKGIVKVFNETRDLDKAAMAHDSVLREYFEVASKSSEVLGAAEIDCAILHDDFKPTNLLISSSGVVVGIDFLGRRRGPVSHDIFRFLSDLDFYRNLVGRSFALSSGSKSNDFDVFLAAYGGRAGGIARQPFVYLYFLTILSALVHQRKKFNRRIGHMIRMAVFRGIAKQLSHELTSGVCRSERIPWRKRPRIPVEWGIVIWQSDLIWSFM
jgi:serine/threonine protein kinase